MEDAYLDKQQSSIYFNYFHHFGKGKKREEMLSVCLFWPCNAFIPVTNAIVMQPDYSLERTSLVKIIFLPLCVVENLPQGSSVSG